VFGSIKDVSYSYYAPYLTDNGPLLPLIVTRCLGSLSDSLLMNFELAGRNDESSNTSVSKYHHGTESIGSIVDNMLCKAYRCLHGFSLVGTK
jgi:hypothetical protein